MKRKKTKRIIWIGVAAAVIIVVVVIAFSGKKGHSGPKTVKVERRNIVDKVFAIGSIEPLNEIAVKSKISGVVGKLYVDVGDFVKMGDLVLEIRPDPTPLELVQAKRNVEMKRIALETLERELKRNEELKKKSLISDYDFEILRQHYDEAALSCKIAE